MSSTILGLDLDGVLYDFHDALYIFCQYELGYSGSYIDFWTKLWDSFSEEKKEYLVSIDVVYDMKVPSSEIKDFLEFSEKNSNAIYYITSRPSNVERLTRRYLRRYNFPFQDNLIFSNDKASVCRLYGVTDFLDDDSKQVESVSKVSNALLMEKPWNINTREKYKTVKNLKDFREAVFSK